MRIKAAIWGIGFALIALAPGSARADDEGDQLALCDAVSAVPFVSNLVLIFFSGTFSAMCEGQADCGSGTADLVHNLARTGAVSLGSYILCPALVHGAHHRPLAAIGGTALRAGITLAGVASMYGVHEADHEQHWTSVLFMIAAPPITLGTGMVAERFLFSPPPTHTARLSFAF